MLYVLQILSNKTNIYLKEFNILHKDLAIKLKKQLLITQFACVVFHWKQMFKVFVNFQK